MEPYFIAEISIAKQKGLRTDPAPRWVGSKGFDGKR